jgi:signal transduction histidine kinase
VIKKSHQQRYVAYLATRRLQEFTEVEYTVHHSDQAAQHLIESSQKTDDINGHQPTYIITLRDITEIRNTAKQLQQGQKMEAIGNMAGGIAHDLNNVLSIVNANLQLLQAQSSNLDDDDTIRINAAQLANQRGAGLIDNLLQFSRNSEPVTNKVCINQSLSSFQDLVKHSIQASANIEMAFNLSGDSLCSHLSEGEFHDALLNLIFNSRDAIRENGTITISTHLGKDPLNSSPTSQSADDYAIVCVSDDGEGIPKEHLTRVFEPFYTTKGVGMGSGLGLSMVYGFIKRSGASIQIDSEVDVGTKIVMRFPLYS